MSNARKTALITGATGQDGACRFEQPQAFAGTQLVFPLPTLQVAAPAGRAPVATAS